MASGRRTKRQLLTGRNPGDGRARGELLGKPHPLWSGQVEVGVGPRSTPQSPEHSTALAPVGGSGLGVTRDGWHPQEGRPALALLESVTAGTTFSEFTSLSLGHVTALSELG